MFMQASTPGAIHPSLISLVEHLRKFMETHGQEMGYSVTQVAMRAGHDPSMAAKHYSGRVSETDRALATAVDSLISPSLRIEVPGPPRQ